MRLNTQSNDAVIVGAGPAGTLTAWQLSMAGWRVTLIDELKSRVDRLEMITPRCHGTIQAVGLDSLLSCPQTARRCLGIRRRWNSAHWQIDDFINHPGGQGFVISRVQFDRQMLALALSGGVSLLAGRVMKASQRNQQIDLMIRDHSGETRQLSTGMAIDASGRSAVVARRLGSRKVVFDRYTATRTAIGSADRSHGSWFNVWADNGKWGWHVVSPAGQTEFWTMGPPDVEPIDTDRRVDCSPALLDTPIGSGWCAIGDAAASFDPLCSQGLFHALGSAHWISSQLIEFGEINDSARTLYTEMTRATFLQSESGRQQMLRSGPLFRRGEQNTFTPRP